MIIELTNETHQVVGGVGNSTWFDDHPWETAGILAGVAATVIGCGVFICCYKLRKVAQSTNTLNDDSMEFFNPSIRLRYPW